MKKLLILTTAIMTSGLALPAAANNSQRGAQTVINKVFVSGYHSGTPIYSKRVKHGQHSHIQRLSAYELQCYLERQRKVASQKLQRTRSHASKSSRYTGRR